MKSTFSIIFYLKRQVVKKDGTVPVMGRITVDGTQAQFSCKTTANPDLWDTKGGRMMGKSMQALEVNRKLDKMRVSISKHYQEIMDRDNFVTADKVKNAFLGLEYRCHTLMKVYSQSRDEMEKQYKAGIKSLSSFTRYRIGCAYVGEFLQSHYHVKDIALKELSLPFITDYETFLRTEKHLKINSAMVFVRNLRAMVFRAIDNEWLVKDPFRRYEYKEEETTREFLSKEEIHLLMETPITRKKMSMVRDLFLFCCFTGLAFIDLYNLKEENIKEFFDEGKWIVIHRQKTGTEANIKLLDYPKQIMEKYRGSCEDGRVFPVPNYKSCMDSLKRLGKKCGITKPLSWHMSRHSFATSVCLSNGVPIETVSSMLGHKDIKTTQVYAKITKEKLSKDVEKLSQQINNIEEFTFGNVCNDNTEKEVPRSYTEFIEKVENWIKTDGYVQQGLTIKELSEILHTNRTYLSAYIKTTYKMTFREWITSLRLEYAKNILKEHPEINIQKLAESSGFLSRSNFIKAFTEKEGCTPGKWKKANQE